MIEHKNTGITNNSNINNFLSSLIYLQDEAKKEGYHILSQILHSTINEINQLLLNDNNFLEEKNNLNNDLSNALSLMNEIKKINHSELESLFRALLKIKTKN